MVRNVIGECEIFNVNDNFWTSIKALRVKRASHSLITTDNLKWVYVFGGVDEKGNYLDSIERLRINNPDSPI